MTSERSRARWAAGAIAALALALGVWFAGDAVFGTDPFGWGMPVAGLGLVGLLATVATADDGRLSRRGGVGGLAAWLALVAPAAWLAISPEAPLPSWVYLAPMMAGAATLFLLAAALRSSGVGHGALVVVSAYGASAALGDALDAGRQLDAHLDPLLALAARCGGAVGLGAAFVVLARYAPARWPCRLGPLVLLGPADVIGLVAAVALLPFPTDGAAALLARAIAPTAAAALLGWGLSRAGHRRAAPAWLGGTLASLASLALAVQLGFAQGHRSPGPFAGTRSAVARLTGGDSATDAPRIAARLGHLGLDGDVEARADGIEVHLRAVSDPEVVLAALAVPGRFEVAWIADGDGVGTARDCAASRGCQDVAIEAPILDADDIVEAAPVVVDHASYVGVRVSAEAADRLSTETARSVGRKLALILDGEVVSTPTVMAAIEGGELWVDGATRSPGGIDAFVAAVRAPLGSSWTVSSVRDE